MGEPVRLQKFLSAAGVCSRRHGERYIREGRVRVNGATVTAMGVQVDPESDRVEFDGRPVRLRARSVYLALNKPRGYVTSCEQPGARIVLELISLPDRVYPVGRLDKDSTGLLLLTNDGSLHHRLAHPSVDHEKEYLVTVNRRIPDGALQKMADGLPIRGTRTRPARVERLGPDRFRIVLREGRNRQIRRMAGKVGFDVTELRRIRVANVRLGGLAEGEWRHLTDEERDALLGGLRPKSKTNAKPPPNRPVKAAQDGPRRSAPRTKPRTKSARSSTGRTGTRRKG